MGCQGRKEPGRVSRVARAKAMCAACPSKMPCLQYALDNDIVHGIFGGKTDRERRNMLSKTVPTEHTYNRETKTWLRRAM